MTDDKQPKQCKCARGTYERANEYREIQICCNQCHRVLGVKFPIRLSAEETRRRQMVNKIRYGARY